MQRLLDKPELHDKVEFEIVLSCYTLIYPEIKVSRSAGFSDEECEEIANSLRKLTNNIVHHENGLWRSDEKNLIF